ncbi:M14 family metallopeptidase [Flagellimonas sp.]|uniref:M14 family metallopeptidase n=1 Tax=Flagellimonas sp. TaxID=2058762 RepID=UPI003B502159
MINHKDFKEVSVYGRYVASKMLEEKWLSKLEESTINVVGESVNKKPIKSISVGEGSLKILMWSQMHGNESTTTKAVLDLVNFLHSGIETANAILENCSLLIVPILNPDGAENYTRVNANAVDLNRDAKERTQPESKILRKLFNEFQPNFCFNLHDQRTLFSAGEHAKPATVSFLSPSSDVSRKLTPSRETAMKLIVAMNQKLQEQIAGQVGRYDDGFNDNCVGDSFQMSGVPTILFEAGHYPNDYEREQTRSYIFQALVEGVKTISEDAIENYSTEDYFKIPENQKLFYDILIRNAHKINSELEDATNIGIRYKEILENGIINFVPEIADIGNMEGHFGHQNLDCSDEEDLNRLKNHKEVMDLILDVRK